MAHEILLSDESRFDIIDAFSWYEMQREGLGKEFEMCLETGFEKIAKNPLSFQKRYKNFRICFIRRFPYGIHFLVQNNTIRVFAIFHTSRDPHSWQSRLE